MAKVIFLICKLMILFIVISLQLQFGYAVDRCDHSKEIWKNMINIMHFVLTLFIHRGNNNCWPGHFCKWELFLNCLFYLLNKCWVKYKMLQNKNKHKMKLVVRHLEPHKIIVYLDFVFCKKKNPWCKHLYAPKNLKSYITLINS